MVMRMLAGVCVASVAWFGGQGLAPIDGEVAPRTPEPGVPKSGTPESGAPAIRTPLMQRRPASVELRVFDLQTGTGVAGAGVFSRAAGTSIEADPSGVASLALDVPGAESRVVVRAPGYAPRIFGVAAGDVGSIEHVGLIPADEFTAEVPDPSVGGTVRFEGEVRGVLGTNDLWIELVIPPGALDVPVVLGLTPFPSYLQYVADLPNHSDSAIQFELSIRDLQGRAIEGDLRQPIRARVKPWSHRHASLFAFHDPTEPAMALVSRMDPGSTAVEYVDADPRVHGVQGLVEFDVDRAGWIRCELERFGAWERQPGLPDAVVRRARPPISLAAPTVVAGLEIRAHWNCVSRVALPLARGRSAGSASVTADRGESFVARAGLPNALGARFGSAPASFADLILARVTAESSIPLSVDREGVVRGTCPWALEASLDPSKLIAPSEDFNGFVELTEARRRFEVVARGADGNAEVLGTLDLPGSVLTTVDADIDPEMPGWDGEAGRYRVQGPCGDSE